MDHRPGSRVSLKPYDCARCLESTLVVTKYLMEGLVSLCQLQVRMNYTSGATLSYCTAKVGRNEMFSGGREEL